MYCKTFWFNEQREQNLQIQWNLAHDCRYCVNLDLKLDMCNGFERIVACPRALYAGCFQIFDEKNYGNEENKPVTAVSIFCDSCA